MIANNLPPRTQTVVGRKHELADVTKQLGDSACRLLTLVGPGGIGKTTLAQLVGWQFTTPNVPRNNLFRDGVFFISLQQLASPGYLVIAIADALSFSFSPQLEHETQLINYLRSKSILLILDNFEQLVDSADFISRLLTQAPRTKILVTSRELLNIREEQTFTLNGLKYPPQTSNALQLTYDSVQLFVKHAWRIYPEFSLDTEHEGVKRICQLVEGLPLAIELAASWVRSISAAEIADEIERGLDILEMRKNATLNRHQSIRVALDSSWNRLTEAEQYLFKQFAVFKGGFNREAAEQCFGATRYTLANLVDKSWLRRTPTGRFAIHELLRQYGEERLYENADEMHRAYKHHAIFYAQLLKRSWVESIGSNPEDELDKLEVEFDNIHAFWLWVVKHPQEADMTAILTPLRWFYTQTNRLQLVSELQHLAQTNSKALPEPLTTRELEILQLVANGSTNADVANHLILAMSTVKWYMKAIFGKLQVTNRTQAVNHARKLGLIDE